MPVEIERKFLVIKKEWNKLNKPEGQLYQQGYISDNDNKTVRVRTTPQAGFITIKGKTTGASRSEFEYEIPPAEAKELLDLFCNNRIVKTRYMVQFSGKTWEVDEFAAENTGLIVAEIELQSESEEFEIPRWIDKEVTKDSRYFNSNLVKHPYRLWDLPKH